MKKFLKTLFMAIIATVILLAYALQSSLPSYDYISADSSKMYAGSLILVNSQYMYQSSDEKSFVNLIEHKSKYYQVTDRELQVHRDIIVSLNSWLEYFYNEKGENQLIIKNALRDKKTQQNMYDEKVQIYGPVKANNWAAMPGYSEHHTGYAMDVGLYDKNIGNLYYSGDGKYKWLSENAHKYGFILRYAADKTAITGISSEPWHYRYVGVPHASIMKGNNLCLEEYIDYVKRFEPINPLVHMDESGYYEIFYIPATDNRTQIRVRSKEKYTISGNNTDGFIVTEY